MLKQISREKNPLEKNLNWYIDPMKTKTWHEPYLQKKKLWTLFLASNSTNDNQILVDHYKFIPKALYTIKIKEIIS